MTAPDPLDPPQPRGAPASMHVHEVRVPCGSVDLDASLFLPQPARGVVLFAHGSGSGRHSSRNREVASSLAREGIAALLLDLLTAEEDVVDQRTRQYRFDIQRLTPRFVAATAWVRSHELLRGLPIGYFGASTGSAVALAAAADLRDQVSAIVSRGGRPDLAGPEALAAVRAATLLIVGGADPEVLELNKAAARELHCVHGIEVVAGATHLFEEPGALGEVAALAKDWFSRYLGAGE